MAEPITIEAKARGSVLGRRLSSQARAGVVGVQGVIVLIDGFAQVNMSVRNLKKIREANASLKITFGTYEQIIR